MKNRDLDWLVDLNFHGTNPICALLIPSETDRNIQNKAGFIVLTKVVAGVGNLQGN